VVSVLWQNYSKSRVWLDIDRLHSIIYAFDDVVFLILVFFPGSGNWCVKNGW